MTLDGRFDEYDFTAILANSPRKDSIYLQDENLTFRTIDIGDIIVYSNDKVNLRGPIKSISEKMKNNIYTLNIVFLYNTVFIGLSVTIPEERYTDCTVTMSTVQSQNKRIDKVAVSGATFFRGNYIEPDADEIHDYDLK